MKLLFIEDNRKLGEATRKALTREGFAVDLFDTPEDGWHAWQMATYDAVVLDIMLARHSELETQSGLDLLSRVRAAGIATPVLLLTALGSVGQRVQGLDAGADDYLIKPFAMEELVARLRALGRRPLPLAEAVIQYGDVIYDVTSKELSVGDGRASLSRGESIILERFLRAPERVITKAQLGDSLHSMEQDYTENSIHVHIHRVRSKLADLGAGVSIRTLRGLGYMAVQD
ncbi:response regulator transcription factor [Sphingomonas koreensis]|jgi:two-component system response regulator QseB|uniref:response regulator transcription factor n=1 Tax=Sphingomonas koreensis TaxID=93064 RepID=UPI00234F58F9|nr:response regulator transcription factor [Sphingomonas koreensis]MDC7812956.1 response regulator transcription factor [Sphingomonas koreensis]